MVPVLPLQIPGAPELVVLLLILVLLFVPTMLLVGGGVAGYLLFFRDDDGEDATAETVAESTGDGERELEDA